MKSITVEIDMGQPPVNLDDVPDNLFAKQVVMALTGICADPGARKAIENLWRTRARADHVASDSPLILRRETDGCSLGVGGLLNGLSDTLGNGGYRIAAQWSGGEDDALIGFRLVKTVEHDE